VGFAGRGAPVIAVALLAACTAGTSKVPTSGAPASVPGHVTTASPSSPTTADPLVPVGSPDAAANALFAAWAGGDRAAARRVATADAVATLFFYPSRPISDRGCQDPLNGQSACAFGVGNGLIQLHTVMALVGGWYVESLTVNGS
jgi:ABC-type transport system substrate-binding protein